MLDRFPCSVVYVELGHETRVLALAHAKRRPGFWLPPVTESTAHARQGAAVIVTTRSTWSDLPQATSPWHDSARTFAFSVV